MTAPNVIDNVVCLGCGCACDDIGLVITGNRIVDARNACSLGTSWFGDGQSPTQCLVNGNAAALAEALTAAARPLTHAARPLVYVGPGISCESQGAAVAIADLLHALLDSPTSDVARFVLAGQERGAASSTLGEIRNRADVVVFWAVDIAGRYPRFESRYAPDPIGLHAPDGRRSRTVLAVDVGDARATVNADRRVSIDPANELSTLGRFQEWALVRGEPSASESLGPGGTTTREIVQAMRGRYIALVYDAEEDDRASRSPQRFDALASLSQALNARTRCAAIPLRAGGNRSGSDAVLVAQSGYPFAVDFSLGYPQYDPYCGSAQALLERGDVDVALIVGDATLLAAPVANRLRDVPTVLIGPHASTVSLGRVSVAIDTGRDGIHSAGTAFRMDDVPLPLRASLDHARSTVDILRALASELTS